jgi:hypothetical protein
MLLFLAMPTASADDTSSGSGSIDLTPETTTLPSTPETAAGLRAAAIAWAKTFLTGSPEAMRRLQGPECRSSASRSIPKAVRTGYLRALRTSMRRQLGEPLDEIRISGVELRNVSARRGEAQVLYELPVSKVGNDNWVEFTLHHGQWKVSDCKAPILGNSTAAVPLTSLPAVLPTTTTAPS